MSEVSNKVRQVFLELAGDRAERLFAAVPPATADLARHAGIVEHVAVDIAFHLSDWTSDAAFLLAVHLYPERFTPDEIADGICEFLIHAPNHVAAAAKLYGYPVKDIFEIGALENGP